MGKLKVGVFGVGRGIDIAQNFKLLNCEIVAMCDKRKDRMDEAIKKMNDSTIAIYNNFDDNYPFFIFLLFENSTTFLWP